MSGARRDSAETGKTVTEATDPVATLAGLIAREPTQDEATAWAAMGPSHRRRTADRIVLMRRWAGDRGDLTAEEAARTAGVSVKYFYEMASAWKRTGTLAALGAFTTAKPTRGPRLASAVTNALQANVARVVDEGEDAGISVEAMRRNLEQAARDTLVQSTPAGEAVAKLPSPRTVRTFVERELVRRAESASPGSMVVLDACPVTMRREDGTPHTMFAVIDRGTGLVLGHALGELGDSVGAYARACRDALTKIEGLPWEGILWARSTARLDLTVGEDLEACEELLSRYARQDGLPVLGAIERGNRFGAAFRRFVGDRVGRVQFRPTWLRKLPPAEEGSETFDDAEAAVRADADISAHNRELIGRFHGRGEVSPPENLLAALRFLASAGRG